MLSPTTSFAVPKLWILKGRASSEYRPSLLIRLLIFRLAILAQAPGRAEVFADGEVAVVVHREDDEVHFLDVRRAIGEVPFLVP